jgi:large subunit ribosomal protein L31
MKQELHPQYHTQAKVTCACGNSFSVGSTLSEIHVEICSMCHPFYTGKQKLVDSAHRVEKFQARAQQTEQAAASRKGKKVKKARAQARKKEARKIKADETIRAGQ